MPENAPDCTRVPCAVCRADKPKHYLERDGYRLVRCRECGMVYVNPCPSEEALTELYEDTAYLPRKRRLRRLRNIWWIKRIERFATIHGKLLDIGCSQGDFGLAVKGNPRWEYHGIDSSKVMTSYARCLGLNVTQGLFGDLELEEESLALVTMWHVLEHVRDPRAMLADIHRPLETGGLLALQLPDISHWRSRYYGFRWKHFIPPIHLSYFSKATLRRLLEELGFQVVYSRRKPTITHLTTFARKV